jgi:cytidylate kinase
LQVLNRQDKQHLVIELYRQGKTIRQIAAAAHLSFTDIGAIIRKIDGRDKDGDIETKDLKYSGFIPIFDW